MEPEVLEEILEGYRIKGVGEGVHYCFQSTEALRAYRESMQHIWGISQLRDELATILVKDERGEPHFKATIELLFLLLANSEGVSQDQVLFETPSATSDDTVWLERHGYVDVNWSSPNNAAIKLTLRGIVLCMQLGIWREAC